MTNNDNVQIPIEVLRSIGDSLQLIKSELADSNSSLKKLSGHDAVHGDKVQTAVDNFFEEWAYSRQTLIDNLSNFGVMSGEIADKTEKFDSDLSKGLDELASQIAPKNYLESD